MGDTLADDAVSAMNRYQAQKDAKKREKYKLTYLFTKICVVLFAITIISGIYIGVVPNANFNKAVHGHFSNAYYASDPLTMRNELVYAKTGMQETLGLRPDMYSTIFPWAQTPDNRMDWQYRHIDSILIRIDEFQTWEKSNAGSQQMQDVYTAKLDNIRKFIKEDGWSDDIAYAAYMYNNYLFVSLINDISLIFSVIFGFLALFSWMHVSVKND
jgi:hypothetical protein